MCFFDSPIARCEVVHELVLTDQTQFECACEHHCSQRSACPLRTYFTKTTGMADGDVIAEMKRLVGKGHNAPAPAANPAPMRQAELA